MCIGVFFSWDAWTIRELETAQARFASAGLPMTVVDIAPPTVPDADNASTLIAKIANITARAEYGSVDSTGSVAARLMQFKQRSGATRSDAEALKEAREILALPSIGEILGIAREAADCPGFDAKLDLSLGASLRLDHLAPLRTAADVLKVRARLSIGARAKDEAARDLWRLLNLADFLAAEPTLISQLVRTNLIVVAIEELGHAVAANVLTEAWAKRFSERMAAIDLKSAVLLAIDGERIAFGKPLFEDMLSGKIDAADAFFEIGSGKARSPFFIPKGWMRLEYATYLNLFHRYRSHTDTLWSQPVEHAEQMSAVSTSIPRYRVFVLITLPAIGGATSKFIDRQMQIAATHAGLAAHRYRLRHGSFPASLKELVPEFLPAVPIDHYSGTPLIYRRKGATFLLYSVGKNGRDEGGRSSSPEKEDDLGFSPALSPLEPAAL